MTKLLLVPFMIFLSGGFMPVAWLGHLRIREYSFFTALALSWAIVLPEYILNVGATRYGYGTFTGAQMASIHLTSGVICVTLVSRYVLGEAIGGRQLVGLALLAAGMTLMLQDPQTRTRQDELRSSCASCVPTATTAKPG